MSDHESRPLSSELVALLEDERARPEPPADIRGRLLSRIEASIAGLPPPGGPDTGNGGSEGPGSPSGGSAPSAGAGSAASVGAKILARPIALAASAFALGCALGAAATKMSGRERAPQIVYVDRLIPAASSAEGAASVDRAVTPEAPASALPDAPPRAKPAQPTLSDSAAAAAAPFPSARDEGLAAERAQLELAKTALGRRDYASALDALARHARTSPRGQLAEEREALAVQALVGAGRETEARARAERFRRDFPSSMLLPVVEAALR